MTPYRAARLSALPLSTAAQVPAPLWRRLKRLHRRGLNPMVYVGHVVVAVVQSGGFGFLYAMLGRPSLYQSIGCIALTLMHLVFWLITVDNGRILLRRARAVRSIRATRRVVPCVPAMAGRSAYLDMVSGLKKTMGHSPPDTTPAFTTTMVTDTEVRARVKVFASIK